MSLMWKLVTLFFLMAVILTASPAHANPASLVSPVDLNLQARTDLSMLESLKPISFSGKNLSSGMIEEPVMESELSGRLNQISAIRQMMRSA